MDSLVLRRPSHDDVPVRDWMLLGSDPDCALAFKDPKVAARHARLELKDGRWILRDLRSPEGTWLNQTRVSEAVLEPGDWIRVGDSEIQFTAPTPAESTFPIRSKNAEWNETLQSLDGVAATDHPILLLGPSGTGKDVLAQTLHERSARARGPFISVNCCALTETLVESELFGHVKGSFTGALGDRKGAFEAARGGTLFLDEIGDLSPGLQAKLLRALENQEIRPVGADRPLKTDVRIVAATHQNLHERIAEGLFRADLYYRLNVVTVELPPLAHRMEDFEDLLYGFCRTQRVRFSIDAINRLKQHPWPGNIRELRNLVSRAQALYPKQSIELNSIDRLLGSRPIPLTIAPMESEADPSTMPVIKEIEKQMILKRLRANRGNQRRTAADLNLPKSTLHDRIRAYNIQAKDFKGLR